MLPPLDAVLSLDEILQIESEQRAVVRLRIHLRQKASKSGFHSLTSAERNFAYVYDLEGEINNGGFDQYFLNPTGDHTEEVVAALQTIGAHHTAALVQQAMSVFPGGVPPKDQLARGEALAMFGEHQRDRLSELDAQFMEYQDDIPRLLMTYVKQNRSRFV